MNPVEIEQAISDLAEQPFDAAEFPYAFLQAFGNKDTTLKRLRTGASNKSDLGGVLQPNNIHIKTCELGAITETLNALRQSPATTRAKAKFILATDGDELHAEDLNSGETVACAYADFPDHFGFFLPLAGISTVKQIRESAFDIKATGRLNRLYVELIKDNPDWGGAQKRHEMNHFMARLIFCFFAEDTDIFVSDNLFTATIDQMSNRDGSNTHEVIGQIFRAMNTAIKDRPAANLPRWADAFPYVNGGLFSGSTETPRFSKIAQRYLSHIGTLDWTKINPDIFGSMIQAVADDDERSVLGMHYTSVPNILKVLNPLFLDDLRAELEAAGENARKLANLRTRMSKIRVFDPACGSGNFLVIAYKEIRALEAEINRRRGEADRRTEIPLTNYRGIELRDFSAEIARLALIIAEYQCDVTYRGQKEALAEFLPLDSQNWITCGNALRLDWLSICPPTGSGVKIRSDDLFQTPLDQAQIDFENDGGETYICGNPPYKGGTEQDPDQKSDMRAVFENITKNWKSLDYISGWFVKFADYAKHTKAACAFVSTNSICQGEQVARLWPLIFQRNQRIKFAHTSFKWANLAAHNAGVTVIIVGLSSETANARIFGEDHDGNIQAREVSSIGPYLVPNSHVIIEALSKPISQKATLTNGSKPVDGGFLSLTGEEANAFLESNLEHSRLLRPLFGSDEFIKGKTRYCLWIRTEEKEWACMSQEVSRRIEAVAEMRARSTKQLTKDGSKTPHLFQQIRQAGDEKVIIVPKVSSEGRDYLPVGLLPDGAIITDLAFGFFNAPILNVSIVASKVHHLWIKTVCGQLETRIRYSNTLGWNTFPVPKLTEKNREDLTRCAENILLAREAHFPATIADLYDPEKMPENLRAAHDRNDETLERIYIGRRFRNDTERLEKLFEMYTKMTTKVSA